MLFITGTDTGVGKTYFSCQLIRQLRESGLNAVGFKPLCCGDRDDAEKLVAASENALTINECNPIWMRFPASPYTASIIEERPIDLGQIRDQFSALRQRFPVIIVEGVGGWSVPIETEYFVSDLAREFALPVLIVAANRLGVLNHTLLTAHAIRQTGLECRGVVLNNGVAEMDLVTTTNHSILEEILRPFQVPVLGEMERNAGFLETHLVSKIREILH